MARWVAWPRLWARMANLGMAAWLCLAFVLTASAACAQDGTFTGVSKNGYIRIGRDVICHPKFVDPTGTAKDYADCQRLSPGVAAKTRKLYRMPANAPLLPDGRTLEARIVTPKGARLAEAQATVYDRRERDEPDALYTDMDAAGSVIDLAMACTDCHLELWAGDELLVRWLEGPSVEHVERLAPLPSAKAVVVQFRYRTVFSGYGSAVAFDLSKHPMWLQARRPRRCRGLAPNCGAAGVRWSLFHGARQPLTATQLPFPPHQRIGYRSMTTTLTTTSAWFTCINVQQKEDPMKSIQSKLSILICAGAALAACRNTDPDPAAGTGQAAKATQDVSTKDTTSAGQTPAMVSLSCQPGHLSSDTAATEPGLVLLSGKFWPSNEVKSEFEALAKTAVVREWPSGTAVPATFAIESLTDDPVSESKGLRLRLTVQAPLKAGWHTLKFAKPSSAFAVVASCSTFADGTIGAAFSPSPNPVLKRVRICEKAGGQRKVSLLFSEPVQAPAAAGPTVAVTVAGQALSCADLPVGSGTPDKAGLLPTTSELSVLCPAWDKAAVAQVAVKGTPANAGGVAVQAAPGTVDLSGSSAITALTPTSEGCWDLPLKANGAGL